MGKPEVKLTFAADSKSLEASLKRVEGAADQTGSKFSGLGKTAKVASLAIFAGLGIAAKAGFDELREGEKVSAQTTAALKSTGGAARVTQGHIEGLANAIAMKSGIDDEAIQSGQNLLLSFQNIRNEAGKGNAIFDRSSQLIADLSTRMGKDTTASATILGKALNDPLKGLTSLNKIGVKFTDAQKAQVKAMVAAGDVAGAQKVILGGLEKSMGGAADAAGKTLAGQLNIAKIQFENMSGQLMSALLPALGALAGILNTVLGWLSQHETVTKVLIGLLAGLAAGVWLVNTAAKVYTATQILLNTALFSNPIGLVILAVAGLAAGIVIAYKKSETFRDIVKGAFEAVKVYIGIVVAVVKGYFTAWRTAIEGVEDGAVALYKGIKRIFGDVVSFVGGVPDRITSAASGMFDGVKEAFRSAINWVIRGWNRLRFTIPEIDTHIPGVGKVGGGSVGVPRIPELADGGIVTRPTLALIGEAGPEAVVPLSRGRGAGMSVTVNIIDRTAAGMSAEQRRRLAEDLGPELRRYMAVA